ncbi:Holliday junction branch migration protein RuvA [Pajaroellobacter abortibovis]|uniref:Holliday junction branch migration complex subunit RuvA n=1 Tax=Pajaroellobacter abortibovis TaxID=1882918 RepID=A0A1L6MUY9_9BACT|nr:Holliday junction branch migration protein RuvA [Pajaroellobacter abortibovis]APR99330.1 Holliday junction DNA helicase RuvA [Pajaroellobacter abortibovis]
MIGRLFGRVIAQGEDNTLTLRVGGVGYDLSVPVGTVGRLPQEENGEVALFVHTYLREDMLVLFGFATELDRLTFRLLIGVSNIGPKIAIGILSFLSAQELIAAIAKQEFRLLTQVPGIGHKMAQRLVLELQDKLPSLSDVSSLPLSSMSQKVQTIEQTVVSALVNMGYRGAEAECAVASLGAQVQSLSLPELIREALTVLSK